VVCIGASTGGTVAIEDILVKLPPDTTGIVVVQHMPGGYTKMFAERLDALCEMEIVEAENGMSVRQGRAIIARGGYHLLLQRRGSGYYVDVKEGPPVNRHKPSVDVLFRSAANAAGEHALGMILTGMGDDGARGMTDMSAVGAYTVAQDEASSVVFGMPHVAIQLGGVSRVLSLKEMPGIILAHMKRYL
jgi:two-component system chemotaxis response regulator CheB